MAVSEENTQKPLSYKDAGVNIEAGNEFVNKIKHLTKSTHRPEVLTDIGGFGGLFSLCQKKYKNPVLVSGTDGVGTKLRLAQQLGKHDTIGIDLVAMCVNDIIVTGAEPLFFLDYFATGKLVPEKAHEVVKGIAEGCRQAKAALIGGETAEMPGMYQNEDYDLAGFCVGVVEKTALIEGKNIKPGDKIIGLHSSGPHSNGYSLIRKVVEQAKADLNMSFDFATLGEKLLEPTRIYVNIIQTLLKTVNIKAMAHITGGGLTENVPRVLPEHTYASINTQSFEFPPIFQWLQKNGQIEDAEMLRTFNCGIGMVLVVAEAELNTLAHALETLNEPFVQLGHIQKNPNAQPFVDFVHG